MDEKIYSLLREYGFRDDEIRVYLYLVGNEELTAYRIAKDTNMHRSTVYDLLDRLAQRGFCTKTEREGTDYYQCNGIDGAISKLKSKESLLLSLEPEIRKMQKMVKSRVTQYSGLDSQKKFNYSLFDEIRKGRAREILVIGNGPAQTVGSNLFIDKLVHEIKKSKLNKKMRYRGIWDSKFRKGDVIELYLPLGENKFLDEIPTKVTTIIYKDKVGFLYTDSEPQVVEINNELIALEIKAYFEFLWKLAEK